MDPELGNHPQSLHLAHGLNARPNPAIEDSYEVSILRS